VITAIRGQTEHLLARAFLIPLVAIVLGDLTFLGIVAALIGIAIVCLAMVLINVTFNMLLFNTKS